MAGLRCPYCQKPVGFGKEMQEWDEQYGEDVFTEDGPDMTWALVNIYCPHCKECAYIVDIGGAYATEEQAPEILTQKNPEIKTVVAPQRKKPKN